MLVVTRKADQELKIGDQIKIVICEIRGDKVRLGIIAPPDVYVSRPDGVKGTPVDQST